MISTSSPVSKEVVSSDSQCGRLKIQGYLSTVADGDGRGMQPVDSWLGIPFQGKGRFPYAAALPARDA